MATEAMPLVSSGADLLNMAPQDAFSSETPISEGADSGEAVETAPDAGDVVDTAEEPAPEPEAEPADEQTEQTEETPEPESQDDQQEQQQEAAETEELPEGVRRGQDRTGKKGLFVTPERWKTIYDGGYKPFQALQELAGEPLTPEVFEYYQRALMGQERLFGDLLSGQSGVRTDANGNELPTGQAAVIKNFFDERDRAVNEGEIAGNPMVPFTQQFYKTLQARDPQAYAALRADAAKDLIEELYGQSATDQNRNLYLALGHVADALSGIGLKYKPEAEMQSFFANRGQQNDPLAKANQRIQELQAQLNGNAAKGQTAQFDSWQTSVDSGLNSAMLEDAVKPAVAHLANQGVWAKNPEAFNDLVVKRLHDRVDEIVRGDKPFHDRVQLLMTQAKRAVSAQKRQQIGQEIRQLFVNRAALAAQNNYQPIANDAARLFTEKNKQAHARAQAGQTQRNPRSQGATVQRSLVPNNKVPSAQPGSRFDPEQAARDLQALLA